MLKGRLETGDELSAKHTSEYLDGEKEVRTGSDPAGAIERESAGGDNTVDMGMKLEFLVPGVEHAEEADLGPEMSGVCEPLPVAFLRWREAANHRSVFCSAGPAKLVVVAE
jgi:hypothetical protein